MRRFTTTLAAALAVSFALGTYAEAKPLKLGFADSLYDSSDPNTRQEWLGKTADTGASIARITVAWSGVATAEPAVPSNPADPAYDWTAIDAAVADTNSAGLDPLLTVFSAPSWAEGEDRPGNAPSGTWKPDPEQFGEFGEAIAARYAGQVRHFQAWNEQNIYTFLNPQYQGGNLVGPNIYRRMLNAFYEGVHNSQPNAVVITGGTAPYGDPPGGRRTRPLTFIRDLLCLNDDNRPEQCGTKAKFDAIAHHPINTSGGPKKSAIHPDDASTPDVKHVVEILRQAEKRNRLATKGRHQVWLTEFWWETRPPDKCTGVKPKTQAKWISQALRLFQRQGARVAINFQIRDTPYRSEDCGRRTFQSGAFFSDGTKKPSFKSFRNFAKH